MESNEQGNNISEHTYQGVKVIIPKQKSGIELIPVELPLDKELLKEKQDHFTPLSLVINIEFQEKGSDKVLEEFDPPIEFYVNYSLSDLKIVEEHNKKIKIAYWKNKLWKLITSETHNLTDTLGTTEPNWAGVLHFLIKSWGEPTIGIGE